jgi:hypothetical protein
MKQAIQVIVIFFLLLFSTWGLAAKGLTEFNKCVARCNQDHGICVSYCKGDAECLNRCATARGECVSGCNAAMW